MSLASEAQELVLHQFQNSKSVLALIRALIAPFDIVDGEIHKLARGRYIKDASGIRLDFLGRIVGQERDGMDDEEYWNWIRCRILINRSQGQFEDVLKVFDTLLLKDARVIIDEHQEGLVTITQCLQTKVDAGLLKKIISCVIPCGTPWRFKISQKKNAFRFNHVGFGQSAWAEFV